MTDKPNTYIIGYKGTTHVSILGVVNNVLVWQTPGYTRICTGNETDFVENTPYNRPINEVAELRYKNSELAAKNRELEEENENLCKDALRHAV